MTAMAKIKNTMTVSLEEFGKKAGEYALDEFDYKGLTIRQWADKITSGEYQPVKHGRWIIDYAEGRKIYHAHCSECGKEPTKNIGGDYYIDKLSDFCPNCGAMMDGDSE